MTDDELLDGILQRERGFVKDPSDPGCFSSDGELIGCNWGLNPDEWSEILGHKATTSDVQAGTREQAKPSYRKKYLAPFVWISHDVLRCLITDTGVLEGVGWATRELQRIVGVKVDGNAGPITQAAVNAAEPDMVIKLMIKRRVTREINTALSDVSANVVRTTRLKDLLGWWNRSWEVGVKPL